MAPQKMFLQINSRGVSPPPSALHSSLSSRVLRRTSCFSVLHPLLLLLLLLLLPSPLPALSAIPPTAAASRLPATSAVAVDDVAMPLGSAASAADRGSVIRSVLSGNSASPSALPSLSSYQFSLSLSDDYQLFWTIDNATAIIRVAVNAKTSGYVGLGFSEIGAMVGSGEDHESL